MARPIAKDHDAKRQLILNRAAQLFAEDGFDGTSVRRVAAACEISKANIYHYYDGKDDILFAILDQRLGGLRDRICGMDLSGRSPEECLRLTLIEILLAYQGADHAHQLQATSLRQLSTDRQATLVAYQRDLVAHLSALITAVAPDLYAGDAAKLKAATMSVFGMLNWYYMWNKKADAAERRDYGTLVARLCMAGLRGL